MAEIPLKQSVFCPRCTTLVKRADTCTICGWERPQAHEGQGTILWQLPLDGEFSRPYHLPLFNKKFNLLFFCIEKGGRFSTRYSQLNAIVPESGEIVWTQDLEKGHITRFLVDVDGFLLIHSENNEPIPRRHNQLRALDPETGRELWSYAVPAHSLSAPAVIEDTLFFTIPGNIGIALELTSGNERWQVKGLKAPWTPVAPTAAENSFYIGGRSDIIQEVTLVGTVSDFYQAEKEGDWFDYQLVYQDSTLYALNWNKVLYALDTSNGRLKWSAAVGRGATAPPVVGEYLYLPMKDLQPRTYSLQALAKENGQPLWNFERKRHFRLPVTLAGSLAIAGGNDGFLYALDRESGKQQWQLDLNSKIVTPPVVAGSTICLATEDGRLAAVRWQKDETMEFLPASAYRAQKAWRLAGTVAVLAGAWLAAARDFEEAGDLYQAAQLYEEAGYQTAAARLYLKAEKYAEAARIYQVVGDIHGEAEALLALNQYEKVALLFAENKDHSRAAEIYRNAGHLNRAAAQFALAGKYGEAAEIYKKLDKLQSAAEMYEKAGCEDEAVATWNKLDKPVTAAGVLERQGELEQATKLLEARGFIEEAVEIWRNRKEYVRAAKIYERAKRWNQAAELYELAEKRQRAARLYTEGGRLKKAAGLYLSLFQFGKAAELFLQSKDPAAAAQAYEKQSEWRTAAQLYLSINPPGYGDAGRCYEAAAAWQEAAAVYEAGSYSSEAVRCWLLAENAKRAAQVLNKNGQTDAGTAILVEAGELVAAAEVHTQSGQINKAADLYRQTGNTEQALDLLAKHEAWSEYRELATRCHLYEREAEACLALAQQSSRTDALTLYLAAAQAYERAASQYEEENAPEKTGVEMASLWLEAAKLYARIDTQDERITWCNRHAWRLLGWPQIVIDVKAKNDLVVGEWHKLQVSVKNMGFGHAFDISLKVVNDEFEGDMIYTQSIVGSLPPNETRPTIFSVKPKTAGSSVPMKIELSYFRPNDERVERHIAIEVPVYLESQRYSTPVWANGRQLIDVYEDSGFEPDFVYSLAEKIDEHFNTIELEMLMRYFSVDVENVPGTIRFEKALHFVEHLQRRHHLEILVEKLEEERPDTVSWRATMAETAPSLPLAA